jgi:predicted MFS family arabinose efflux permease
VSLVLLGSSIGEGGLPVVLVSFLGAWGWRPTLAAAGCFGLVLVIVAAAAVRKEAGFRTPHSQPAEENPAPLPRVKARPVTSNTRYFLLSGALFAAMPMVLTATVFHQALVAEAKGVSLQWFAVSFIAFAVSRVVSSVLVGPAVDRFGSKWPFCLHLLPLAGATAALIAVSSPWVVPVYWFCAGVTGGMGMVLQTTVVAERVSPERLGAARSVLTAAMIVASAVGPSLFGFGLAAGASMPGILWVSVAGLLVATALGFAAHRTGVRAVPWA